ncbi:hypothetical protein BS78_05G053300 [Paspalum vaginatum]|nr:hypothetical protein BS78_05G053300 [Paspalum vaginatum]
MARRAGWLAELVVLVGRLRSRIYPSFPGSGWGDGAVGRQRRRGERRGASASDGVVGPLCIRLLYAAVSGIPDGREGGLGPGPVLMRPTNSTGTPPRSPTTVGLSRPPPPPGTGGRRRHHSTASAAFSSLRETPTPIYTEELAVGAPPRRPLPPASLRPAPPCPSCPHSSLRPPLLGVRALPPRSPLHRPSLAASMFCSPAGAGAGVSNPAVLEVEEDDGREEQGPHCQQGQVCRTRTPVDTAAAVSCPLFFGSSAPCHGARKVGSQKAEYVSSYQS